jgi:hypothetical protein
MVWGSCASDCRWRWAIHSAEQEAAWSKHHGKATVGWWRSHAVEQPLDGGVDVALRRLQRADVGVPIEEAHVLVGCGAGRG